MTSHVRVGVRKASRRIGRDTGDAGKTICGAPITVFDIRLGDLQKLAADRRRGSWDCCAECLRLGLAALGLAVQR